MLHNGGEGSPKSLLQRFLNGIGSHLRCGEENIPENTVPGIRQHALNKSYRLKRI
jgi:hypothetical protein